MLTQKVGFDTLVKIAQDKIGCIIDRPKMKENLIQKPPFRFLHDTISAIILKTGFGEGLYDDQENDFTKITERQQRIRYFDKIFRLIGICQVNQYRTT